MKKLICIIFLTISPLYSDNFFDNNYDFESRMDFFNIPGVSLSIISNREIILSETYGESINTETIFQGGGISKVVTALGVFKLIEDGSLDLDRDINDYLTTWKLEENIYTRNRKVTLRMLLSHTAGIEESGIKGSLKGDSIPKYENTIKKLRYFPGLKRRYSWSGYSIIQKVIEDVSGVSFDEYISRTVLNPLNMNRSSFNSVLSDTEENIAIGHDLFGTEVDGGWRVYSQSAAIGLWTTPTDISKMIIEIQNILTGEYEGILSKDSLELILSYQVGGWGLGPSIKFSGEDLIFRHSGESAGYISYFIGKAYKGEGVVIMCNGENSWKLIMEVIHSFKSYKSWGI